MSIACEPTAVQPFASAPAPSHAARPRTLRALLSTSAARLVFLILLGGTLACAKIGNSLHRRSRAQHRFAGDSRRLLVTGTFYNAGWFASHVPPLSACRAIDRIVVVCDAPVMALEKVTYACPPGWLRTLVGRSLARAITVFSAARRERCGVLMGYHIMPNALVCLAVGRLLNRRVVYQMTGGPAQVAEGGWRSENALLRRLGGPSALRTRLMNAAVREMDDVIVRGERARGFLENQRLARSCMFAPGSIDTARFRPGDRRPEFDLITVGRLVSVKRIDRLLTIMAELRKLLPQARLNIVGDGPLRAELEKLAGTMGLSGNVVFSGPSTDVAPLLQDARAFILTSDSEGLSIAMIEAMACGLPALAPDIGDLSMLLAPGRSGEFIDPASPREAARILAETLGDANRLERYSKEARRAAIEACSVDAVAAKWGELLTSEARP